MKSYALIAVAVFSALTASCNGEESEDFSLNLSPSAVTVNAGSNIGLIVAAQGNSSESISLSASSPSGIQVSFGGNVRTGSYQTVLVSVAGFTTAGNYQIVIEGRAGGSTSSVPLSVTVHSGSTPPVVTDVQIYASQSSVTVQRGTSVSVNLSTSGNSSQQIVFSAVNSLSGLTTSFNPNFVFGGSSTTLTIFADSNAPQGSYNLLIRGTAGSVVREISISVLVTSVPVSGDFSISVSPNQVTVSPGNTVQTTIFSGTISGSSQTVTLSTPNLPSGIGATHNSSLVSGGSTPLTLNVGSNVQQGVYNLLIRGSSGSVTREVNLIVNVSGLSQGDFSLSIGNSTLTLAQNTMGTINVGTVHLSGNPQLINLSASAPSGVSTTFNPSSVYSGAGSVLTINPSGVQPGTYTITVWGVSPFATRTITFNLVVTQSGGACDRLCLTPQTSAVVACWSRFQPGVRTISDTLVPSGTNFCCPDNTGSFTVPTGTPGMYTGNGGSCSLRGFEIIDPITGAFGGKK